MSHHIGSAVRANGHRLTEIVTVTACNTGPRFSAVSIVLGDKAVPSAMIGLVINGAARVPRHENRSIGACCYR